MQIVKLTTPFPEWPLARQTPGGLGIWGDYKFQINVPVEQCDYWVVYEGLLREESSICRPECTLLITAEPPNVKTYRQTFVDQFGALRSAHRYLKHRHKTTSHAALPWHVGRRTHG